MTERQYRRREKKAVKQWRQQQKRTPNCGWSLEDERKFCEFIQQRFEKVN